MAKSNKLLQRGTMNMRGNYISELNITSENDFVEFYSNGYHFVFGKKSDGSYWARGQNSYGQLGLGDTASRPYFEKISLNNIDVKKIICGAYDNGIITNDGRFYHTGKNTYGFGGDGVVGVQKNSWTLCNEMTDVVDGAMSLFATYLLKSDGTLWVSGQNSGFCLGIGDVSNSSTTTNGNFVQVPGIQFDDIILMKAYSNSVGFLRANGDFYYCGTGGNGQYGNGTTTSNGIFEKTATDVIDFAIGEDHVFVVKTGGALWGTGSRSHNNLGTYQSDTDVTTWQTISSIKLPITKIVVTGYSSAAILSDGTVWTCGYNTAGECGIDSATVNQSWAQVKDITKVIDIVAPYESFIAKDENGDWYAWGENDSSHLPFSPLQEEASARAASSSYKGLYTPKKIESDISMDMGYSNIFNIDNRLFVTNDDGDYFEINKFDQRIITGYNSTHTVVMKNNDVIYSVGNNTYGQLGRTHSGSDKFDKSYAKVSISNVKDVVVAGSNTYFVKKDGTLWGCGYNGYGQLGLGSYDNSTHTTPVKMDIDNVKEVAAGLSHIIALKNDGTVWTCGYNVYGQLGLDDTTDRYSFTKVNVSDVNKVFCGFYTSFIIKNDGTVWATGSNQYGLMGLGEDTDKKIFTLIPVTNVRYISASNNFCFVTFLDGSVSVSGASSDGACGLGSSSTTSTSKLFVKVNVPNKILKVVAQKQFAHYLTYDGCVLYSGYNANAINLNAQNGGNAWGPTKINASRSRDISNGESHIAYTLHNGTMKAGGSSYQGQCAYSSATCITYGLEVSSLKTSGRIAQTDFLNKPSIVAGYNNVYYISKTGRVYGTGSNANGELCFNSTTNYSTFTDCGKLEGSNIKEIVVGRYFAFALKYDGTIASIGSNASGQLGLNNTTTQKVFTTVSTNADNVKKIACGLNHAVILKHDGTVWSTGDNQYGQLALGNTTNTKVFTKVSVDNVKDIFCTSNATLVLKNNGELFVSGRNDLGELGLGDKVNKTSLTQVPVSKVKTVFSGSLGRRYYVLKEDDTLWGCGVNSGGQLGIGTNVDVEVLTQVPITDIKNIRFSSGNTYIIKNDGTALGCGANDNDQLGLGNTEAQNSFVELTTFGSNIHDIQVGLSFAIVVKDNGYLYGCGLNSSGQLGLGSTTETEAYTKIPFNTEIMCSTLKSVDNQKYCSLINGDRLLLTTEDESVINSLGSIYTGEEPYTQTVILPHEAKEVMLSKTHFLILLYNGDVYGCGSNIYGQLLKDTSISTIPELTKLDISGISSISGGDGYSIFVDSLGNMKVVGLNDNYQLGLLDNDNRTTLTTNSGVSNIKKVVCRDNSMYVLTHDKKLYAQGFNPANGRLGLGTAVKDSTVTTFIKALDNVINIEVFDDHAKATLADNNIAIAGKRKETYKSNNIDSTVFNKIKLPAEVTNKVAAAALDFEDDVYVITKVISDFSEIEISNKSLTNITLNIKDEEDPVIRIDMSINGEVISRITNIISSNLMFEIPQNKIIAGKNTISFIAYTETNEKLYATVEIIKQAMPSAYKPGDKLLIKDQVYRVTNSIPDGNGNYTLSLDKVLETDLVKGDMIHKLINEIAVSVQTNGQGTYKPAELSSVELLRNGEGYRETYTYKESNMKSVSTKIEVKEGNSSTTLKKPTMSFKTNED